MEELNSFEENALLRKEIAEILLKVLKEHSSLKDEIAKGDDKLVLFQRVDKINDYIKTKLDLEEGNNE